MAVATAIATVVTTALSAAAQSKKEKQEALIFESQAKQKDIIAGQQRAESQIKAKEERRQARLLQSRAQARGAASGAIGPGLTNIESDIIGEGELSALTSLYEGEEAARSAEYGAELDRYSARNKRKAARTTLLTGIASSVSKGYGSYTANK